MTLGTEWSLRSWCGWVLHCRHIHGKI